MTWREATSQAISRLVATRRSNLFTRQLILEKELQNIIQNIGSSGKTPEQTLSKVLQELRESKEIEFLGSGDYRLLNSTLDPVSSEENSHYSPDRISITISRPVRDTEIVRRLKIEYGFKCQICGIRLELQSGFYCEAHHIRPLGSRHGGPDIKPNLIVVCPNHHALLDYAAIALDPSSFLENRHFIHPDFIDYHNAVILGQN